MGAFRNSYTDQEKMHMISRRSAQGGFSAFMCANWGLMCNAPSAMGPGSVIADFDGPQENWQIINDSVMGGRSQGQWSIVNDDVMGGVSQGSAQAVDDVLLFKGDISLENNGGFSSVSFKPESKMDMSASTGIKVRVKSSYGRTYRLWLECDTKVWLFWSVSYMAEFETVANAWTEVNIPFSALQPSIMGRDLSPYRYPWNSEKVQKVGFLLYDKQAGDFQIEVDWIKTY